MIFKQEKTIKMRNMLGIFRYDLKSLQITRIITKYS